MALDKKHLPMMHLFFRAQQAATDAIRAELAARPEDERAFDCGFAWVTIRPARGPLVSALKAKTAELRREHFAAGVHVGRMAPGERILGSRDDYEGGWKFWCPGQFSGQSVRVWEVGARAFRDVLAEAGISATVGSRLD